MQRETLSEIRARVRALWGSRRVCGIVALACAFRIDRIATLAAKGRLGDEEAFRMALETEAVAMLFAPLPRMEASRVSL